jgi:MYXO-CTERM domain-containing protein
VLTEGGTFVSQPDWVSVGNVTSGLVGNLSIAPGKKYIFAVRAVSKAKGSSIDTRSNGAVVETPSSQTDGGFVDEDAGTDAGTGGSGGEAADAGTGGSGGGTTSKSGCGCRTVGREETPAGVWALAGLVAVAMRRRARKLLRA